MEIDECQVALPTSHELLAYIGWNMGWIKASKKSELVSTCPKKRKLQEDFIKNKLLEVFSEGYKDNIKPFLQAYFYQFYRFYNESSEYLERIGYDRQRYFHCLIYPYFSRLLDVMEVFRVDNSPTFLSTFVEILSQFLEEDKSTKELYTLNRVFNSKFWGVVPEGILDNDDLVSLRRKYAKGSYASDLKLREGRPSLFYNTIKTSIRSSYLDVRALELITSFERDYTIIRTVACLVKTLSDWIFDESDWPRRRFDKKLLIEEKEMMELTFLFKELVPDFSSIYSFRGKDDEEISGYSLILNLIVRDIPEQIKVLEYNWPTTIINQEEISKRAYGFWLLTLNPLFGPATQTFDEIKNRHVIKINNDNSVESARVFLNGVILSLKRTIQGLNGELCPIELLRYIYQELLEYEFISDCISSDKISKENLPKSILTILKDFKESFHLDSQIAYIGILAFGFALRGRCFTSPTHCIPWQSVVPSAYRKVSSFVFTETFFGFQLYQFEDKVTRFEQQFVFFENLVSSYNYTLREITAERQVLTSLCYNPLHKIFKQCDDLCKHVRSNISHSLSLKNLSFIKEKPEKLFDCKVFGYYDVDPYLILVMAEDYLSRFGLQKGENISNTEFIYDRESRGFILIANDHFRPRFINDKIMSYQRATLSL